MRPRHSGVCVLLSCFLASEGLVTLCRLFLNRDHSSSTVPEAVTALEQPYEIPLTAQMGNNPSSDYGGRPISGLDPPTDTEVAVASQHLPQQSVQDNISWQPDDAGTTQVS